jgi:hypothetical protein
VKFDVFLDKCVEEVVTRAVDRPLFDENIPQRSRFIGHPGVESGEQVGAVDEVVLKGEDAEEKVLAGVRDAGPGLRRVPGRSGSLDSFLAERSIDPGGVCWKPPMVLVRIRSLALSSAPVKFYRDQVAQERRPYRVVHAAEQVLDREPIAIVPRCFQAIAGPIDLLDNERRKLAQSVSRR